MSGPSAADLLAALGRWDAAWAARDADALAALLAPDATLHADGVLFRDDLRGAEAVAAVHRRYFGRYEFCHVCVATAANPDTRAAFGFFVDRDSRRAGGEGAQGGADVAGAWKLRFNADASAVTDIFFLRQLNPEEAAHKMADPDKWAPVGLDIEEQRRIAGAATAGEDPSKAAAARSAAEAFSHLWASREAAAYGAKAVLAEGLRVVDLTHGGANQGRDQFCVGLNRVFDSWEPVGENEVDVGVARDGCTAIVHWVSSGREKGAAHGTPERRMYGLNLMKLDDTGNKVVESVGFRQLAPVERAAALRPDAFAHAEGAPSMETPVKKH